MTIYRITIACCLSLVVFSLNAKSLVSNDSIGLPGDNFSLEGALELFKKSSSPEEFEKLLNTEGSLVNNLDLNEDGETDYIKVIDKSEGNVHTFILQDAISETENQDIAVIELEKSGEQDAVLQIVGDKDIYGEETIIEPKQEIQTNAGTTTKNSAVNVWTWPVIRYVYSPSYTVWISPMGWRSRPVWWQPWKPVRYAVFYPYRAPYRRHYVVAHSRRVVIAPKIYRPVRTTSVMVTTRNKTAVTHYRATRRTTTVQSGGKNATRQSTTVTGKRGNTVTKKSTTVTGPRGNTVTKKTTRVRKGRH